MKGCSYTLDARDRIETVDAAWEECARAGRAPELYLKAVVGRSLWTCISDARLRELFGLLLTKVRSSRTTLEIPFRCDALDEKRWMRLSMRAASDGSVLVRTALDRTESRPWPLGISSSSGDLLTICSWCNAVQAIDGTWIELENDMAHHPGRYDPTPSIRHRLCPACENKLADKARDNQASGAGA